ncbi:MAG: hypothetical protein HC822_12790 [Oscillochloris sp.]|nr:hypothetical protein [Oscillochloris sp.]
MNYLPLLSLQLTHAYYSDGRCRDLVIEPAPQTRRLLGNYRCLLKDLPDGVRICPNCGRRAPDPIGAGDAIWVSAPAA